MFMGAFTAWKVSKYGPEKTPYLDTFHAVLDYVFAVMMVFLPLKTLAWKLDKK